MKSKNNELNYITTLSEKMARLQSYLMSNPQNDRMTIFEWYSFISQFKRLMGNLDNDVSFIGCMLAKQFLSARHQLSPNFDVADKPQGAPGLDIDEVTLDGYRIIAEIKTTIPYKTNDLGAKQKKAFEKDFYKLKVNSAAHKYFFVTEPETFEIVRNRYLEELRGVSVILVPAAIDDVEFIIEVPSDFRYPSKVNSIAKLGIKIASSSRGELADSIRKFIYERYILEAKKLGLPSIQIRSGDIRKAMRLNGRYAAVCSAMGGRKIEENYNVTIIDRKGVEGAEFFVTYSL